MSNTAPDPRGYAMTRRPDLPWGYWLLSGPATSWLTDEQGRQWPTLRHYLWEGRLGMASSKEYSVDEGCELLLAILRTTTFRSVPVEKAVREFFDGIWREARHFRAWLEGQALIQGDEITLEGQAIMRMLIATRWIGAPDLVELECPSLHPWNGLDKGHTRQQREQVMAATEELGRTLRYRFVRRAVAGRPAIQLIGHQLGNNIPLSRVLWTLVFPDDYARDRMFAWLAQHLDRWQAWGELAADKGSRALSEHLLHLKFADEPIDLG